MNMYDILEKSIVAALYHCTTINKANFLVMRMCMCNVYIYDNIEFISTQIYIITLNIILFSINPTFYLFWLLVLV